MPYVNTFSEKKRVSFKIEKKIASNNKNMRTCDVLKRMPSREEFEQYTKIENESGL